MLSVRRLIVEWAPLSSTLTFIAAAGSARRRGGILIGRELRHVIGQVAAAHGTKCIKEDGRDNLHQLYYGTGPATMPSGMLPRSPASRRGRSQEGSCCPESLPRTPSTSTRLPRLLTSTAGEATKKSDNGDKKARAAQRAAQGRHLHLQGYQGCQQVQQERLQRSPTMATRRLVLPRELPKDAIYMATKAVDKYSRRGYKEVRERRQEGSCLRPREVPNARAKRAGQQLKRRILNLL